MTLKIAKKWIRSWFINDYTCDIKYTIFDPLEWLWEPKMKKVSEKSTEMFFGTHDLMPFTFILCMFFLCYIFTHFICYDFVVFGILLYLHMILISNIFLVVVVLGSLFMLRIAREERQTRRKYTIIKIYIIPKIILKRWRYFLCLENISWVHTWICMCFLWMKRALI